MTTQIKGAVLQARKAFVAKNYGDVGWQRVLEALPEDSRQQLAGNLLSTRWYPFSVNMDLDATIVKVLGGGNASIFKAIGAASASENLGGPHRPFLAPGNPELFLSRTASIYSFYYDIGRRDYEPSGPNSGVMTTFGGETTSKNDCLTVIGWYEEALKMCGATQVDMVEESCRADGAPYCRYQISWKM
jgi:hypothetical protein